MSFRTALSGLNAAATDLQVIGNNIANASTTGFKQSRAEFASIYATSNQATGATAESGAGARVAAISQQFGQGQITFTDNNLDLAISGSGFFRLSDNGEIVYSRAGAFGVDRSGYIVNAQGLRLTGYAADPSGNITGSLGDLRLSAADLAPKQTARVSMQANLDARETPLVSTAFDLTDASTYHHSTSVTLYDSLGNPRLASLYFVGTGPGAWDMYMAVDGALVDADPNTTVGAGGNARSITFDTAGRLTSPGSVATDLIPGLGGSAPFATDIDLAGLTQFGSGFAINSLDQNGYGTGRLAGVDIGDTGVVSARYSNGQSMVLAQVALANFANPQGLQQLSDTSWAETFDSGPPLVGAPGTGSLGMVQSGALEGANVDLTEQLVAMITAQRNYQANAQVISTNDAITQAVINIR
ncbi:MAG: flagellar hook protein FlgE [Porticoccaceae bacterium]